MRQRRTFGRGSLVLEPATPEGEQIIIEPPAREDRMILPVDVDESLSPVGSSFTDNVDKGAAEAEVVFSHSRQRTRLNRIWELAGRRGH